jgi:hypothetical protein
LIIVSDDAWPLWARVLIAVFAVGLFVALAWRYYRTFRRH